MEQEKLTLNDILFLVFTCRKFKRRADAVLAAWGKDIPNFWFVTDEDMRGFVRHINLGQFSYQGLSQQAFLLWKFIRKNFCNGDKYKWIIKIDDDCYLRPDKLIRLLSGFDHTLPWYIGDYETFCKMYQHKLNWVPGPAIVLSQCCFQKFSDFILTEKGKETYFASIPNNSHHAEDLAIGQCLEYLHIHPTHGKGFYSRLDDLNALKNRSEFVVAHLMYPFRMRVLQWLFKRNQLILSLSIDAIKTTYILKRFLIKTAKKFTISRTPSSSAKK